MLKDQPWIRFAPDLETEWRQCLDEGLDVADFEALCREAARTGISEAAALEIAQAMHARPLRQDFPFDEPSALEEIQARRPQPSVSLPPCDEKALPDKIRGAWLGRIAGCLLGKPVEGFRRDRLLPLLRDTDNYPMRRYIARRDFTEDLIKRLNLNTEACWADTLEGISPPDDDTNYTVFTLKLLETYGLDFTCDNVIEAWMMWIPMLATCTAERVAYRNAASGLLPPETALYKNPYREWIGAQIRGDCYGYVCPGDPQRAAAYAFRDAAISHVKNGIYGEMFIAAMIAAAAVCGDIRTVIRAGLEQIPEKCRLRRDVLRVIGWFDDGLSAEQIIDNIHTDFNEHSGHDWCHTDSNAMIVVMALLCGGGDFGRSICLAVQSAFDTDCNGATVGSIVGMMNGSQAIPDAWTAPFAGRLKTAIDGFNEVDADGLAERTLRLIRKES